MEYGAMAPADVAQSELAAVRAEFDGDVQLFVSRGPQERDRLRERLLRRLPADLCPDVNAAYEEAVRRSRALGRNRPLPASTRAARPPRGRREARPQKAAASAATQACDEPPAGPATSGARTVIARTEAPACAQGLTGAERRFLTAFANLAVDRMLALFAVPDDDREGSGETS